jgi:APA family basic amino acid/polyamine antiporter
MITASSLFIFRWRQPDTPRPYRVWGYPLVPLLFVVASGVLLYYTFTDNIRNSALGSLVILAGIPVFYAFSWRRSHEV